MALSSFLSSFDVIGMYSSAWWLIDFLLLGMLFAGVSQKVLEAKIGKKPAAMLGIFLAGSVVMGEGRLFSGGNPGLLLSPIGSFPAGVILGFLVYRLLVGVMKGDSAELNPWMNAIAIVISVYVGIVIGLVSLPVYGKILGFLGPEDFNVLALVALLIIIPIVILKMSKSSGSHSAPPDDEVPERSSSRHSPPVSNAGGDSGESVLKKLVNDLIGKLDEGESKFEEVNASVNAAFGVDYTLLRTRLPSLGRLITQWQALVIGCSDVAKKTEDESMILSGRKVQISEQFAERVSGLFKRANNLVSKYNEVKNKYSELQKRAKTVGSGEAS